MDLIYIAIIIIATLYLFTIPQPNEIEYETPSSYDEVSIIIPARNEENNIGRCLESLKKLDYPNYEIIVVDGNSTDQTIEIAKSFEDVKVISEPEKPDDWVGKPWGCYNGYLEANSDRLLFTDADTYHHPESLTYLTAELEQSENGFMTILTNQEYKSFFEHLLTIVFLFIGITTNGSEGTDEIQIANGQYMYFERETYEELGTHKTVHNSIIEDLEFASIAKRRGYSPRLVTAPNLVITRMYNSLGEIKNGFTKNLALGIDFVGISSILKATLVSAWGMGWLFLIIYYLIIGNLTMFSIIVSLIGYVLFVIMLTVVEYNITRKITPYQLFYPLYYFILWGIISSSLYNLYISKEITWKDREYSV